MRRVAVFRQTDYYSMPLLLKLDESDVAGEVCLKLVDTRGHVLEQGGLFVFSIKDGKLLCQSVPDVDDGLVNTNASGEMRIDGMVTITGV